MNHRNDKSINYANWLWLADYKLWRMIDNCTAATEWEWFSCTIGEQRHIIR